MFYFLFMLVWAAALPAQTEAPKTIIASSLSLLGEPKYKPGFTHFDYVNPNAPKRGMITHYSIGTYDNFHRYALRGDICAGYQYFYDTLMAGSDDEFEVYYPLIAEKVEYAADYSFIIFSINPAAKDQEGQPITAEDAAFSFTIIKTKGVPHARSLYAKTEVQVLPGNRVRFDFPEPENGEPRSKEKLLDIAGLPVFPRRFWENHDFSEPLTKPPLGTGAYRVGDYQMGQYIVLERVKDYWAADLPVRKGLYNFDYIRYDYYRDSSVAFEAFKAGEYDFREENTALYWATQYKGKLFDSGAIVREEILHSNPPLIQALTFNVQRPVFNDVRVRRALNYFFDFEWLNKNLFYNQYTRIRSYFQNTDYAAGGLPSAQELAVLTPIRDKIPPEVFTQPFNPPVTDGTGNIRPGMREALTLLNQAGWELREGKLLNKETGRQMSFELMIWTPSSERYAIPFQRNLARFGIDMRIRLIDSTQFLNRMISNDYDLIDQGYSAFYYPSSSAQLYWHSDYVDSSYNRAGVQDPALDYLIEGILAHQEDPEALLYWGRALDRVVTWNHYIIPQWYVSKFRLAYKKNLKHPSVLAKYSYTIEAWWTE